MYGNVRYISIIFLSVLCLATARLFFHEASSIKLRPSEYNDATDFGYSMGYQRGKDPKLVIGAPHHDWYGRVFRCSIQDIVHDKTTCSPLDIDLNKMKLEHQSPKKFKQNVFIGATIAATEKYFVTCAVMRLLEIKRERELESTPLGECIFYNNSGPYLHYDYGWEYAKNLLPHKPVNIFQRGGTGWNSLVHEDRDIILIAKSHGIGDLTPSRVEKPDVFHPSLGLRSVFEKEAKEKAYTNLGLAMTYGQYFDENWYYAVNKDQVGAIYAVELFQFEKRYLNPRGLKTHILILNEEVGSMFGRGLCSADVTQDQRQELFVGAPAHYSDAQEFDRGAVYVYSGTTEKTFEHKLLILSVLNGARFGSTLAGSDVDGDSISEIFVSAPFENGGKGVLYVLSGHEISEIMKQYNNIPGKPIIKLLTDLKQTQKIEEPGSKIFGFSLLPLPDFNQNSALELSVGSPGSAKVTIFKGIPSVTVEVTSRFAANKPSEMKNEVVFQSCVTFKNLLNKTDISTKLLVINVVTGEGASMKNTNYGTYEIQIPDKDGEICKDLIIVLKAHYPTVNTRVELAENIDKITEFNPHWVTLSEDSKLTKSESLQCRCNGANCIPELEAEIKWGRSEEYYQPGSTKTEDIDVVIRNKGQMACDSCARLRVQGARASKLACLYEAADDEFTCIIPFPFEHNNTKIFHAVLDMSNLSYKDQGLNVTVDLYKHCGQGDFTTVSKNIPYKYNTDAVTITGFSMNRNITDTELDQYKDVADSVITDEHIYTIVNNQSFTWENLESKITVDKQPFIKDIKVFIKQSKCTKNTNNSFTFICPLKLEPYGTVKIRTITKLLRRELRNHLKDGYIQLKSNFIMHLTPDIIKTKTVTTVMKFEREQTITSNLWLIIVIGVILALFLLAIIAFILYKLNFFKRKNKEKLEKAIKRQSIRRERASQSSSHHRNSHSDCDKSDLVIVEESPFNGSTPPAQQRDRMDDTLCESFEDVYGVTQHKPDVHKEQ